MRYSPEEIFKKFINSVLSDASLDFFVKRAAVFLSMMMPVSSLFIFRSVEGSITKLAECNKTSFIPYHLFPLARLRETTMRAASMTSSRAVPMSRA